MRNKQGTLSSGHLQEENQKNMVLQTPNRKSISRRRQLPAISKGIHKSRKMKVENLLFNLAIWISLVTLKSAASIEWENTSLSEVSSREK